MTTKVKTQDRIIETAAKIFYQHGYHATGIDQIVRTAGMTKATLYHYFKSKDELIVSVIQHISQQSQKSLVEGVESKAKNANAKDKLLIIFDLLKEHFNSNFFFGCPFVNAAAEFSDHESEIREICRLHFKFIEGYLEALLAEANLNNTKQLAKRFKIIMMGAHSACYASGDDTAAEEAKAVAKCIIESELSE